MKLEPREAISFWNSKTCLLPDQFSKLTDDEKFLAFTVSGIPKIKSIKTVHKAILSAIKNGDTSQEFNKNMRAVVEPAGWTKEEENRRLDNIFRTNIQTAFNVGRYRQMMKVKEARPFWRYNAVNDSRTRPTHRAVNGKIFRFDHPFWDKWYPPNGFRCRCNVRTLSQREIDRDGLTVETQDPIGRLMNITTPDGIVMSAIPLMPDPGFAFNPGKIFWGNRVDGAASPATWTEYPEIRGPNAFRRKKLDSLTPSDIPDISASGLLPAGQPDWVYKEAFIARYAQKKVVTDVTGERVTMSASSLKDASGAVKFGVPGSGQLISILPDMLKQPFEVWLVPQRSDAGQIRLIRRYISVWKTTDGSEVDGVAVHESSGGIWKGVTAFFPSESIAMDPDTLDEIEKQRYGILLWGK